MDNRALEANASANPPAAPGAPSMGYPKAGNPQTNDPASKPGPYWFFQIGEEVRNVITGAGLTPDLNDNTQLRAAILSMIQSANSAVIILGATFEASVADGEAVRWDAGNNRFDEAIADGTANNQAVGFADVTNSKVYCYGETPALFAGLTPGARYYLDGTTAGAINTTAPADKVPVGIAKSATTLFVDIDPAVSVDPGSLLRVVVFTASGTWNKGANTKKVRVRQVGGGGGAGGYTGSYGGGGAGGGYSEKLIDVTAINSETVTVGAGGTAGVGGAGGAGGTSSFGAHCSATGGAGGGNGGGAGPGGLGSGGDINCRGGSGWSGGLANPTSEGGDSMLGGGGSPGSAGGAYGGGGGSGYPDGFAGASGVVIVEEYA